MKYLERLLLLLAAVMLAGTNKCREDYFFATQARVSISPTTSGTPGTRTPTPDDDGDENATATATATSNTSTTATPTPTATATSLVSITPTARASISPTATSRSSALGYSRNSSGLLGALGDLDQPDKLEQPTISPDQKTSSFGSLAGLDGSWLGNMYKKSDQDELSWSIDSDKDGFVDGLESVLATDPFSARSFPTSYSKTNLTKRISVVDTDFDGLSNQQELQQGTSAEVKDSDSDSIADGIEFLSGTNPLNANSIPLDTDGDGLSDDYEISEGINAKLGDSDGDGLSDSLELEIGSNPLTKDTDLDGIFDGKEYLLGSDPILSDFPNQ